MGLLNHLFEKKDPGTSLDLDAQKRIKLFETFATNYSKRFALAKTFNYQFIDTAVANWPKTTQTLQEIENLVSDELIVVNDEIDTEADISKLFKEILDVGEIRDLIQEINYSTTKDKNIKLLLEQCFLILKAELNLIHAILSNNVDKKSNLLKLFDTINNQEHYVLILFRNSNAMGSKIILRARRRWRAILLEQDFEKELARDQKKFATELEAKDKKVKVMTGRMAQNQGELRYTDLAIRIYTKIAELAGRNPDTKFENQEQFAAFLQKFEAHLQDTALLTRIVKVFRPRYADEKVALVISSFRHAYDLGQFEEHEKEKLHHDVE